MKTASIEKTETTTGKAILTCPHCGRTGVDVITTQEHVGGQGYVPQTQCADEVACWARWDKQHGFKNTPAIREMQERRVDHEKTNPEKIAATHPGIRQTVKPTGEPGQKVQEPAPRTREHRDRQPGTGQGKEPGVKISGAGGSRDREIPGHTQNA